MIGTHAEDTDSAIVQRVCVCVVQLSTRKNNRSTLVQKLVLLSSVARGAGAVVHQPTGDLPSRQLSFNQNPGKSRQGEKQGHARWRIGREKI